MELKVNFCLLLMIVIELTLIIDNIIDIKLFYKLNENRIKKLFEWYETFTDEILLTNNFLITPDTLKLNKMEIKDNLNENMLFNTSNILEYIEDLYSDSEEIEKIDSDSDSELYTETENKTKLIDAHLNNEKDKVKSLLTIVNESDIIHKMIKKNYL